MSIEQDITALERQRRQAMLAADVATLERLFADDLVWIHASAKVDAKPGMLSSIGSGSTRYLDIDCSGESVRHYGDVAIVTGHADMQVQIGDQQRTFATRFTIVWRRGGTTGWQAVHWQSTLVPQH